VTTTSTVEFPDPTIADVVALAHAAAGKLRRRAGDGRVERDMDGDRHSAPVFRDLLTRAADEVTTLATQLEANPVVDQATAKRLGALLDQVNQAQRMTKNHTSFAMAQDLYAMSDLARTAHAVWRGLCPAGVGKNTLCTPDPVRVQLYVKDDFGADERVQGCIWHVAEAWTHWDPAQVGLFWSGPQPAVELAYRLARQLDEAHRGLGLIEHQPYDLLAAAVQRAGYPYEFPLVFCCPQCNRRSHHPDDFDNGYCGACHAQTGYWRTLTRNED
jgi:hypothetical protein